MSRLSYSITTKLSPTIPENKSAPLHGQRQSPHHQSEYDSVVAPIDLMCVAVDFIAQRPQVLEELINGNDSGNSRFVFVKILPRLSGCKFHKVGQGVYLPAQVCGRRLVYLLGPSLPLYLCLRLSSNYKHHRAQPQTGCAPMLWRPEHPHTT